MDLNFQTLFIVTETGIKCRVAAVKESLVLHHSTDYIFSGPVESMDSFRVILELYVG